MSTEIQIDRDRLVDWASDAINVPSFTGDEEPMAELMRDTFAEMGLKVQWQQVEEGRSCRKPCTFKKKNALASRVTCTIA